MNNIKHGIEKNTEVDGFYLFEDIGDVFESKFRMGIILKNERTLLVEYHKTKTIPYIEILEMNEYQLSSIGLKFKNNKWVRWGSLSIVVKYFEKSLDYPLQSLDDIINHYNDIIKIIEKIYSESQIPWETWDHKILEQYSGYFENDTLKFKIYVEIIKDGGHYQDREKNRIQELRDSADFLFEWKRTGDRRHGSSSPCKRSLGPLSYPPPVQAVHLSRVAQKKERKRRGVCHHFLNL
jgi:hypothetical protein